MRNYTAALLLLVLAISLYATSTLQSKANSRPETDLIPRQLPISLNDVMVVLVNHSADPLWIAAWKPPKDDKAWHSLQRSTLQLQIAGSLLTTPGTGPMDQEWAADPRWQGFANELRDAGERAVEAVAARDMEAISRSGDEVVAICEGCHMAFKPDIPTGGAYGELSPTAADFEKE